MEARLALIPDYVQRFRAVFGSEWPLIQDVWRAISAFSYLCTHQGGFLNGKYQAVGEHRVLGQCPLHLSTYDLTRHGIIVSGQAYQSIPQVLLELEGDDIYAVGMMGLLFGRNDNLMES